MFDVEQCFYFIKVNRSLHCNRMKSSRAAFKKKEQIMEETKTILPPCKVCGGKATGFHFGAITCEACKAFYKRSRGRLKPYKCRGKVEGTCEVRFDLIPMCPYCRNLRVVKAGMSEEGVHRGRCSEDRKTQLVIEAKETELEHQRNEKSQRESESSESSKDRNRLGMKRTIISQKDESDPTDGSSTPEYTAKLTYKPGDSFLDLDPFLKQEFEKDDIVKMADMVAKADADHKLYKICDASIAAARNRRHGEELKAKESLVGPLKPLSHEEYTEIYNLTGMDIDDYRAKARIMQYMKCDIDTYIDFIKGLPGYNDLNLHDRITVAKGGFAGWLVLSTIRVYNKELNAVGIVYDILWSSSDFVRYIGKEFSEGMKETLSPLLKNNATQEEVALLKAMHVYTVRPEYGIIHNKPAVEKRHRILHQALEHALKKTRSPDEITWVHKELSQSLEPLNQVARSFRQGVSQWPLKFPEYSCPRILQEIVGQKCEEELLVAVSMQLMVLQSELPDIGLPEHKHTTLTCIRFNMADIPLQLPPCKVCGGKATGRHFGVIACEACKSFFKRNKNRDKPYKCKGQVPGKCPVKASKSPICPFCRLQVCLKIGMSRDAIHRGRVPIDKKTELLLEARDYQLAMEKEKELDMEKQKSKLIQPDWKRQSLRNGNQQQQEQQPNQQQQQSVIPERSSPPYGVVPSFQEFQPGHSQLVEAIFEPAQPELPVGKKARYPEIHQAESHGGTISMTDTEINSDELLLLPEQNGFSYSKFLSGESDLFPTASLLIDDHDDLDLLNRSDTIELISLSPFENTAYNEGDIASDIINSDLVNEEMQIQRIKDLIAVATEVDAATQLYDPEELQATSLRTINLMSHRQAKEQLLGELRPLPHEVYTEIFQATGIDLDDYRAKVYGCIQDMRPDIDAFLKYLCRLPDFEDFSLKDRTLLAKGGFPGWLALSSVGVYSVDLEVWACTYDIIFTTDDFVRYFGKVYSDSLRETFTILQKNGITDEELSLLKLFSVYKERPELGNIEKKETLLKYQELLRQALVYVMGRGRGPEQAQIVLDEAMKIFPSIDEMTLAFINGVKKWPCKFPEYIYPRILLEIVGQACEEELLVAVSVQLNISG